MLCGTLFILSSPSGAGKSSLLRALLQQHNKDDRLKLSVSHTTRHPRPDEKDGVDYHFVTHDVFMKLVAQDSFYEWAQVFGKCYGTHRDSIEETLKQGQDVLLDIDWQGARQIREKSSNVTSIFILPPSLEVLQQRLVLRQQDSQEVIATRMKRAQDEISHYHEFDYVIVNEDFDQALQELYTIICAQRLSVGRQRKQQQDLIHNLIAS